MAQPYDSNVLYVVTGIARKNQIETAFKQAIDKLGIPCRFRVNLLVDREGQKLGYAYVWISSMEVVYALIGLNTDGTERIEEYDDPDWVPPEIPLDKAIAQAEEDEQRKIENSTTLVWADTLDIDEIAKRYKCPKKTRKLGPLVAVEGYEYDDDQLKYIQKEEGSLDNHMTNVGDQLNGDVKKGYFELSIALHPKIDDTYSSNVLISRNIPAWITEKELRLIFEPYVISKVNVSDTRYRKVKTPQYPIINILEKNNGSRMCFITFNPDSNDGKMAYHMTRRITVYDSNHSDHIASVIFNFAYNRNRHDDNDDYEE